MVAQLSPAPVNSGVRLLRSGVFMKLNVSRNWWRFCLLAALIGALLGGAAEFLRAAYDAYLDQLIVKGYGNTRLSLSAIIAKFKWWGIPFWATVIFMIGSLLIHRLWIGGRSE